MKEITVELSSEIEFTLKGDIAKADFITIKEPSGKIAHLVASLKVQLNSSVKNAVKGMSPTDVANIISVAEKQEPQEKIKETPETIGSDAFDSLLMGGADMNIVMECFKAILIESALLVGEHRIKPLHLDKIPLMIG